jgi:hypothetical protein
LRHLSIMLEQFFSLIFMERLKFIEPKSNKNLFDLIIALHLLTTTGIEASGR